MAKSLCTSCGLIQQRCQCCRQTSSTLPDEAVKVTCPVLLCCKTFCIYIITVGALFLPFLGVVRLASLAEKTSCYVELFANSVSVSSANVSAADWRITFVTRSPVTSCEISLHPLNSRLLRGGIAISNSTSPSSSFSLGNKTEVVFEKVVMPEVIGDVIWDLRVEVMHAVKTNARNLRGILTAVCPDIPVKFTTDPAGKVVGSFLGNMRRCEYELRTDLA